MIVQCTNCRARFRVADDKVPERGVKVRCTKCATVFKVTRADAVDGKTPLGRDQFGFDGAAPTTGRHLTFEAGEPTPGPAFAPGPTPATPSYGSTARVPNLPQPASLIYGAASPHPALDFDLGQPPPTPQQRPATQLPPPMQPPFPAMQPPGGPSGLDLALDAAMSAADPFAELGATPAPPPPRAGTPGPHALPPLHLPPSVLPPAPSDDPFADPFAPGGVAAGLGPLRSDDPFAELSNPPPSLGGAAAGSTTDKTRTAQALRGAPLSDAGFGLVPPPAAHELTDPFAALDQPPGLLPSVPTAPEPGPALGLGDFEFGESTRGHRLELDLDGGEPAPAAHAPGTEVGRIALLKVPADGARGEDKPKLDPKLALRQRMRREVASALFNVASAFVVGLTALVVIATLRAPRPLTFDDLGFPMVWLALGYDDGKADAQLTVERVRSGTYETHGGEELFFVTGVARNASAAAHDALHVAVELVRGDEILGRVESVAQLAAGPEELYALDSRKNDELQRQLAQRAKSIEVAARSEAPFVAVFPLGAREVEGADVRLSVLDGVPAGLKAAFPPKEPPKPPPANEPPAAQLPAAPAQQQAAQTP